MTRKRKLIAKPGPGYDGKVEHGTMIVVDPYDGTRLKAQGNVRHDILVHWHSRAMIGSAEKDAGNRFQSVCYRAQTNHVGTCIPINTRVDTSGRADPIPNGVIKAQKELAEIRNLLGNHDYLLLRKIICEGARFTDVPGSQREGLYQARRVRDALAELADFWGYSMKNKRSLPITVYRDTSAA